MTMNELLENVQKTNPEMTMKRLIYELSVCEYTAKSLMFSECAIDHNKNMR